MDYKLELDPPLQLEGFPDQELLNLGLSDMAYIRSVRVDGDLRYMVHAADGTPISAVDTHDSAVAAVFGHDLELATVH